MAEAIIRMRADAGPLGKGLRDAESQFRTFSRKQQNAMKATSRRFAAMSAAAVGVGTVSVRAFAQFDDKLNQSVAIMGKVSDAMRKDMSDAAREVAKTTRLSADEAAESFFFLASAGLNAEQSIAALPQVASFAQAGMFDMATATDLATDAQSALGLTVDDTQQNLTNLTRTTDVLVKANTLANASVEQFSTSLTRKAGASLRVLGKDIEEGVAALAVYADQGVKGEEAGTQLAAVLDELAKKGVKNAEAFEELGISVFDNNGEMRNLADISEDFTRVLGPMNDAQREAALQQLELAKLGKQGTLQLIGQSDAMREYESALRDAGGTTQNIADNQMQSLSAQLDVTRSKITDAAIELGGALAPAVVAAGDVLARFGENAASALSEMDDGTRNAVLGIGAIATALPPAILLMGSINRAAKDLKVTMAALSRSPIGLLATALGIAATAVVGLTLATEDNRTETEKAEDAWRDYQNALNASEGSIINVQQAELRREEALIRAREATRESRRALKEYGDGSKEHVDALREQEKAWLDVRQANLDKQQADENATTAQQNLNDEIDKQNKKVQETTEKLRSENRQLDDLREKRERLAEVRQRELDDPADYALHLANMKAYDNEIAKIDETIIAVENQTRETGRQLKQQEGQLDAFKKKSDSFTAETTKNSRKTTKEMGKIGTDRAGIQGFFNLSRDMRIRVPDDARAAKRGANRQLSGIGDGASLSGLAGFGQRIIDWIQNLKIPKIKLGIDTFLSFAGWGGGKGDDFFGDLTLAGGLPGGLVKSMAAPLALGQTMGLQFTSGLRPGAITSTGNRSDHGTGHAIDMAGSSAAMRRYALAANMLPGVKQVIFSPLGWARDGGGFSAIPGNAGKVLRDHYDHVHVAMYQRGIGRVPGTGDGDTVPAMLEPGEGVLNRNAARAIGGPTAIDALNRMFPRFQTGGMVGRARSGASTNISALMAQAIQAANLRANPTIASLTKELNATRNQLRNSFVQERRLTDAISKQIAARQKESAEVRAAKRALKSEQQTLQELRKQRRGLKEDSDAAKKLDKRIAKQEGVVRKAEKNRDRQIRQREKATDRLERLRDSQEDARDSQVRLSDDIIQLNREISDLRDEANVPAGNQPDTVQNDLTAQVAALVAVLRETSGPDANVARPLAGTIVNNFEQAPDVTNFLSTLRFQLGVR